MSYRVIAIRLHDGGMREDVSGDATLGDAYRDTYETPEEAEEVAGDLRDTWQEDWDLGDCPTYEVEEVA